MSYVDPSHRLDDIDDFLNNFLDVETWTSKNQNIKMKSDTAWDKDVCIALQLAEAQLAVYKSSPGMASWSSEESKKSFKYKKDYVKLLPKNNRYPMFVVTKPPETASPYAQGLRDKVPSLVDRVLSYVKQIKEQQEHEATLGSSTWGQNDLVEKSIWTLWTIIELSSHEAFKSYRHDPKHSPWVKRILSRKIQAEAAFLNSLSPDVQIGMEFWQEVQDLFRDPRAEKAFRDKILVELKGQEIDREEINTEIQQKINQLAQDLEQHKRLLPRLNHMIQTLCPEASKGEKERLRGFLITPQHMELLERSVIRKSNGSFNLDKLTKSLEERSSSYLKFSKTFQQPKKQKVFAKKFRTWEQAQTVRHQLDVRKGHYCFFMDINPDAKEKLKEFKNQYLRLNIKVNTYDSGSYTLPYPVFVDSNAGLWSRQDIDHDFNIEAIHQAVLSKNWFLEKTDIEFIQPVNNSANVDKWEPKTIRNTKGKWLEEIKGVLGQFDAHPLFDLFSSTDINNALKNKEEEFLSAKIREEAFYHKLTQK